MAVQAFQAFTRSRGVYVMRKVVLTSHYCSAHHITTAHTQHWDSCMAIQLVRTLAQPPHPGL
jgi:hypothetical protein